MRITQVFLSNTSRLLVLIAALVYVLAQTVDLQHSHDGDLNLQADCQICLKLSSHSDANVVQPQLPVFQAWVEAYQLVSFDYLSAFSLTLRSRAPPQAG